MTTEQLQKHLSDSICLEHDGHIVVGLDSWLHLDRIEEWMKSQPEDVEFDSVYFCRSLAEMVDDAISACIGGGVGVVTGDDERAALEELASLFEAEAKRLRDHAAGEPFGGKP